MNSIPSKLFSSQLLFQYTVIALAFAVPLSIAGYTALSALLLILWIIEGNWQKKWKMIGAQSVFKVLGFFYLFLVLSLLWSNNLIQGFEHLRKYYLLLLIPIIYTSLDRQRIPQIFSAFLSAMIISELLSYLIFFDLMPFKYKESWSSIDPSPFMHHTPYSIFLIFSIFLMLIRLLKEHRDMVQTIFYTFFIITMTINLFINAGRTGQFSLIVTLAIFIMSYWRLSLLKTMLSSTLIAISIFSLAYWISPNFHSRTNETFQTFYYLIEEGKPLNDSTGLRFMMWDVANNIISQNPILGVGIGDTEDIYFKTLETNLPELKEYIYAFSDFHNTYFQIAVSTGVIGLLLFLYIFIILYKNLNEDKDSKILGTIMLVLLLLYMMIGNFPAAYLTILFVLIMSISLKCENKEFTNSIV